MATLSGSTIASTFSELLRMGNSTLHATTGYYIKDAADTNSALSIATTRVGIGTASPGNVLDVVGTIESSQASVDNVHMSGSTGGTTIWTIQDTGTAVEFDSPERSKLHLKGCNVGIGTDTPLGLLHLKGNPPTLLISDTGGDDHFRITLDSGDLRFDHDTDDDTFSSYSTYFNIQNDGKVGIGTASPASRLHIVAIDGGPGDNIPAAQIYNAEATAGRNYGMYLEGGSNSSDYALRVRDVADAELFYIRGDGNVGIGTTAPGELFHVNESSGVATGLVESVSLADTEQARWLVRGKKSGGTNRFASVGVMYNEAVDQAAGYVRMDSWDGVTAFIYLDEDDDLMVSNSSAHVGTTTGQELHGDITSSDERLKEISSDAFPYGLDTINNLNPIRFKYKYKTKNDWKLGLGAQTTQPIVPETVLDTKMNVDGLAEGETKLRMSYSQFIPILIKATQELTAKVNALENNNNEQGESSNEQEEPSSGGDASSESAGQDSRGDEGDNSDSPDAASGASEASDSSSDDGNESAGSSGSDASDDSEGGSGSDDSGGSEGESSGDGN